MERFVSNHDCARAVGVPPETFRKFWQVAQPEIITSRIPSSQTTQSMRGFELEETVTFLRRTTPLTSQQEAVLRSLARPSIR